MTTTRGVTVVTADGRVLTGETIQAAVAEACGPNAAETVYYPAGQAGYGHYRYAVWTGGPGGAEMVCTREDVPAAALAVMDRSDAE